MPPQRSTWARFRDKHAIPRRSPGVVVLPDQGFCVGTSDHYYACFTSKSHARHGARLLANATNRRVDLTRVQGRGNDRDIIAQVEPRWWSMKAR